MSIVMIHRKEIKIRGIVQGVGFRPFIYSLANRHRLNGFVFNDTEGVVVEAEGRESILEKFLSDIKKKSPSLSRIEEIHIKELPPAGYRRFVIKPSAQREKKFVLISSDITTCEKCLKELFDPEERRFGYPFLNCINCGPRFTIIKDIPYDRDKTTMGKFKMCNTCQSEFDNPLNRRFHTQPNCCRECGPHLSLLDSKGRKVTTEPPVSRTCELLRKGKILAIKGLGGFHLACDAVNPESVSNLRQRKMREEKPFAIMVKDIMTVKSFCEVNRSEETLLLSRRRPIVLLRKKKSCLIADEVAPKQNYLGVMLPYTPLHHLLFSQLSVLVMTSGNLSNEPITYRNEEALHRLRDIADYYLVHNRDIHIRCDDSVTRVFEKREMLIRRSRGYVPEPIEFPFKRQILACGAELKNTFCLTMDGYAFLSYYIGDLENLETLQAFEKGIRHFRKLFSIEPRVIAYDLHPEYLSTKYAKQVLENNPGLVGIPVQHHHAHIASCMADNEIKGKVIGVAFDGLGYGTDGNLWGGEFLLADLKNFQRIGHLQYIPMPGGAQAVKEPWRMAVACLYQIYGDDFPGLELNLIKMFDKRRLETIAKMLSKKINSPLTSSIGRLFDAVSSLLGICNSVKYEGQAAIELEMAIKSVQGARNEVESYNYKIEKRGQVYIIDPILTIKGVLKDLQRKTPVSVISEKFHNTIAGIIINMCKKIGKETKLNRVVLSGGVFQNMFLLRKTVTQLRAEDFKVYTHHRVPTNDGGISLGQAVIAMEKLCA